jgi:hypothetical protein
MLWSIDIIVLNNLHKNYSIKNQKASYLYLNIFVSQSFYIHFPEKRFIYPMRHNIKKIVMIDKIFVRNISTDKLNFYQN